MPKTLFHLAFPVHSLKAAKKFYTALGCKVGRASDHSLIFNFAGNQIVAQLTKKTSSRQTGIYPRHFGLVLPTLTAWNKMQQLARRKKLKFFQAPKVRFPNTPLEHHTFFLEDPSHNLLEFKHYKSSAAIFGKRGFKRVGDRT